MRLRLDKREHVVKGCKFVVAARAVGKKAVAVCWASTVDGDTLRAIFTEVDKCGLDRPIVVYGHVCSVGGTKTFRFEQVKGDVEGFEDPLGRPLPA